MNAGSAGFPGFIYKGKDCALDHPGNPTAFKMTFAKSSLLSVNSLEPLGQCERYP